MCGCGQAAENMKGDEEWLAIDFRSVRLGIGVRFELEAEKVPISFLRSF